MTMGRIRALGKAVRDVRRQVEKNHIFTHVEWKMRGFYMEVAEKSEDFTWFSAEEINTAVALPTAYRQFWEDF